ncbi:MAG TPA: uroporphyrinogen decarboxylase [Cryomorphaceae bacterium]|nr:uroporphyrinogen decarboxylase [Cryomorphaceae bacterium]HBB81654.1 uroporphyrinogen decarboxylase [Cryomorphaceae bacterium]HCY26012.1 uroporphyrinogen decarboxylase [Cryomorphaceae bacterium]|tara:strand:+ start:2303 stop:3325 length:1023 start_codon:yes stop_codon:yes gene_type:complete
MIEQHLFLRTLAGEQTERPPVWFMRQAGRYLPDYMKLKEKYSFFERVQNPDLAREITVMPVDQIGVDAAILFSDILVIAQSLGLKVDMVQGRGPVLETARTQAEVDRLSVEATQDFFKYANPAIKAVKEGLDNRVPLIGFAGSPWTLLCYIVQGQGSKDFGEAKKFIINEPLRAKLLLEKITEATIEYLNIQVDAGCDALQIFDSWGGMLSPEMYSEFSLPYLQRIMAATRERVPIILFAKGAWYALKELQETGAAALGLSWTTPASFARKICGPETVLQGNLDPSILLAKPAAVKIATTKMIDQFGRGKHIVNLGHGVLPQTSVDSARAFVDAAKSYRY